MAERKGAMAALKAFGQPRAFVMLLLGFSSGLPFLLTANTLGYWLRDAGVTLTAIGFLSWVGIAYSLKFLWAPIIDRVDAPLFGRLGRRRGWMLLMQLLVGAGLFGIALVGPENGLAALGVFALITAFASSTQDIVIDAWRIEAAENADELGLLSSAAQFGYRAALLVTDAIILIAANHLGWSTAYALMGALMAVGIVATLKASEPVVADAVMRAKEKLAPLWTPRGFADAVIGPFVAFFKTYGAVGLLMLAMISVYQLPNFVSGPMLNPLYHDIGVSKDAVGVIRGSVGLAASLLGIALAGFCAARFGYIKTVIAGAVLQGVSIGSYAVLAYSSGNLMTFGVIMAVDSFGIAFSGVALVTYMSSLTSLGYTATQYALLSSTYAYLGKFLKGFSGVAVESLAHGRTLMDAYAIFFIGCGAICLPALILCLFLAPVQRTNRMSEQRPSPSAP